MLTSEPTSSASHVDRDAVRRYFLKVAALNVVVITAGCALLWGGFYWLMTSKADQLHTCQPLYRLPLTAFLISAICLSYYPLRDLRHQLARLRHVEPNSRGIE
jgi:hypothetical protein